MKSQYLYNQRKVTLLTHIIISSILGKAVLFPGPFRNICKIMKIIVTDQVQENSSVIICVTLLLPYHYGGTGTMFEYSVAICVTLLYPTTKRYNVWAQRGYLCLSAWSLPLMWYKSFHYCTIEYSVIFFTLLDPLLQIRYNVWVQYFTTNKVLLPLHTVLPGLTGRASTCVGGTDSLLRDRLGLLSSLDNLLVQVLNILTFLINSIPEVTVQTNLKFMMHLIRVNFIHRINISYTSHNSH